MGQHKVAKAIKEKHVIKFQKFDSPKSQKLTLIINGLRSLPRPYGMVLSLGQSFQPCGPPIGANLKGALVLPPALPNQWGKGGSVSTP